MPILSLLSGLLHVTWVHVPRSPCAQTEPVMLAPPRSVLVWINLRDRRHLQASDISNEKVIKTRAAINTVSCLAVSERVEPEEITAVSGPARFASAGRCWGWLLTFQPAVMGETGTAIPWSGQPPSLFLSWCARGVGPRPQCRRG